MNASSTGSCDCMPPPLRAINTAVPQFTHSHFLQIACSYGCLSTSGLHTDPLECRIAAPARSWWSTGADGPYPAATIVHSIKTHRTTITGPQLLSVQHSAAEKIDRKKVVIFLCDMSNSHYLYFFKLYFVLTRLAISFLFQSCPI